MLRRAERFLKPAGILAFAGILASSAAAQSPVISLPTVTAGPGETATVPLLVAGVPGVNAVNFTIRISEGDRALIDEVTGISFSLPAGIAGNYTYEDNTLNYDDPATGAVENMLEYRGVLYPRDSSIAPFAADAETVVVNLEIPIAADVSGSSDQEIDLMVINEFADDGITGLVGISDGSGNSVVSAPESPAPNATRNIAKGDGKVVVEAGQKYEFAGDYPDGWDAIQVLPAYAKQLPPQTPAPDPSDIAIDFDHDTSGFSALNQLSTSQGTQAFGFIETAYTNRLNEGLTAGKVLAAKWNVATNVTNPFDCPTLRLRVTADGFTQMSVLQEITSDPGTNTTVTIPVAGDGMTALNTIAHIPEVAVNNSVEIRKGFLLSFDIFAEDADTLPGTAGSEVMLDSIDYQVLDPASFTGMANLVSEDYTSLTAGTADPAGFNFIPVFDSNTDPALTTETYTDGGLGFLMGGPAPGVGQSYFALGILEKALVNGGAIQVDGSKIYKVDFSVKSGASQPIYSNTMRVRVWVNGLDYSHMAVLESAGPDADNSYLPDADGTDYTIWLDIPPSLAGQAIYLSVDAYNTVNLPGEPSDPSTIQMLNFDMTAYDRPAFLN